MSIRSDQISTSSYANGLFSARRITTAQTLTNNTLTTIIFNEEVIDARSQYDNTTGIFTCSVPGFYQFNAATRVASTAAFTNAFLIIKRNTDIYRGQQLVDASGTNTTYAMSLSMILQLAATDTVQVQVLAASTGTITVDTPGSGTYFATFSGYLLCPS